MWCRDARTAGRAAFAGGVASCIALFACAPPESRPRRAPFRFESCDGVAGRVVSVTEWLRMRFSAAVDPGSVRPETIRVTRLDADGEPIGESVPGTFRVQGHGEIVAFVPRVPLNPDLKDGGLQPDALYRVRIAGYPRPDGLRALDGRFLEEGATFDFRTVERAQRKQLFTIGDDVWQGDPTPQVPGILQDVSEAHIIHFYADAEAWLIVFDCAIRPDSLGPGSIYLARPSAALISAPLEEWPADLLIPVAPRLLRAEEARRRWSEIPFLVQAEIDPALYLKQAEIDSRSVVDGCVLELRPQFVSPPLPDTTYFLAFARPRPKSLEGPGPVSYAGNPLPESYNLLVVQLLESPARTRALTYDFLPGENLGRGDEQLGLPIADGVLRTWEGVARAALAREAGSGIDGAVPEGIAVKLPEPKSAGPSTRDWQFHRAIVPAGTTLELDAAPQQVLRSQGRFVVDGRVAAVAPERAAAAIEPPDPEEGFANALARLTRDGVPFLACAASGELVWNHGLDAPGRVVLLASSNRVRLGPNATVNAAALWIFLPGDPAGVEAPLAGTDSARVQAEVCLTAGHFTIDPELAPRVPLRFRVVSPSVRFDLVRSFEPSAQARIAMADGRASGVRAFVQVGGGLGGWRGPALYLEPGRPLALPREARARVGLEIELLPAREGAPAIPGAAVDRLEVMLR